MKIDRGHHVTTKGIVKKNPIRKKSFDWEKERGNHWCGWCNTKFNSRKELNVHLIKEHSKIIKKKYPDAFKRILK